VLGLSGTWSDTRVRAGRTRENRTEMSDGVLLALIGDDDRSRQEIEVGESVALRATGLTAEAAYEVDVALNRRVALNLRLLADRRGAISSTVLWAQFGLDDPARNSLLTPAQALRRWAGATISVTVRLGKEQVGSVSVRVATAITRPLVLVTDREGRLLNALGPLEPNTKEQPRRKTSAPVRAYVSLLNLPFEGPAQITLVGAQRDWRVGDPIVPTYLRDGRAAVVSARARRSGATIAALPPLRALRPGAYDIVVRPVRYGFEDRDPRLTERDVVGARRTTGLVVRESFWRAKTVLGGCVNKVAMAGAPVWGAPYYRYRRTFARGDGVWAALDPGIVDPGNVGKMCALYVVPAKTTAEWNMDTSLAHLAVLGGNAAAQKLKLQAGCINMNDRLVWPNAQQLGDYDLVADFGNNVADPVQFISDAHYDTPLDVIDGYFTPGFRVVEDPGTLADFANSGLWQYDENSVPMGFQGTVTVPDEQGAYSTPGAFMTVNVPVPMRAHVYFPADAPGITDPTQISANKPSYPLVVIVHGNGHLYTSYDFVLKHLAKNGCIAASIHLNGGMNGLGRANVLFKHLPLLQSVFGQHLQNHIGLMGHSRGGEAILKAARLNQQSALGYSIEALLSLAPTDQYGTEVLGPPWATPYLVLYGSRDGDVAGWPPSSGVVVAGYSVRECGFSLYDRAAGTPKHMVFVYGASHNGFITTNSDALDAIDPTMQQAVTLAYVNAFFRLHVQHDVRFEGIFSGDWEPPSVSATGVKLYVQSRSPDQRTVDDFSGGPWTTSTIGGANSVTQMGLAAQPSKGKLCDYSMASPGLDPLSPHDDQGLSVRWANAGARIEWSIPQGPLRDVSGFAAISVRASQKAESGSNPPNAAQILRIGLKDANGNERLVRNSAFTELPYPDMRQNVMTFVGPVDFTKSAMNTLRIPLRSYNIVCAGAPIVDLKNVASVALVFSETATGELDLDDVAFTP